MLRGPLKTGCRRRRETWIPWQVVWWLIVAASEENSVTSRVKETIYQSENVAEQCLFIFTHEKLAFWRYSDDHHEKVACRQTFVRTVLESMNLKCVIQKNTMNTDSILTDNSSTWRRNVQKYQLRKSAKNLARDLPTWTSRAWKHLIEYEVRLFRNWKQILTCGLNVPSNGTPRSMVDSTLCPCYD